MGQWYVEEVRADDIVVKLDFLGVSLALGLEPQVVCPEGVKGSGWTFASLTSRNLHGFIANNAPETWVAS